MQNVWLIGYLINLVTTIEEINRSIDIINPHTLLCRKFILNKNGKQLTKFQKQAILF